MKKNNRYSVEVEDGIYLVYDSHQDIFVNRFGYVDTTGFLTENEAIATIKVLSNK